MVSEYFSYFLAGIANGRVEKDACHCVQFKADDHFSCVGQLLIAASVNNGLVDTQRDYSSSTAFPPLFIFLLFPSLSLYLFDFNLCNLWKLWSRIGDIFQKKKKRSPPCTNRDEYKRNKQNFNENLNLDKVGRELIN